MDYQEENENLKKKIERLKKRNKVLKDQYQALLYAYFGDVEDMPERLKKYLPEEYR